jgi:hypothetical protein
MYFNFFYTSDHFKPSAFKNSEALFELAFLIKIKYLSCTTPKKMDKICPKLQRALYDIIGICYTSYSTVCVMEIDISIYLGFLYLFDFGPEKGPLGVHIL